MGVRWPVSELVRPPQGPTLNSPGGVGLVITRRAEGACAQGRSAAGGGWVVEAPGTGDEWRFCVAGPRGPRVASTGHGGRGMVEGCRRPPPGRRIQAAAGGSGLGARRHPQPVEQAGSVMTAEAGKPAVHPSLPVCSRRGRGVMAGGPGGWPVLRLPPRRWCDLPWDQTPTGIAGGAPAGRASPASRLGSLPQGWSLAVVAGQLPGSPPSRWAGRWFPRRCGSAPRHAHGVGGGPPCGLPGHWPGGWFSFQGPGAGGPGGPLALQERH